jgi:two-component system phosphate regulon response regulator PhoB
MSKVLLVEDDNNLREIYEARLQAEGYEIASAQDGEQALVVAKQFKPDLVISDVMMPKISGFEMLDILRNTEGLEHTRVIMLTALGQAEDKTRADSLGADRYLVKSQVTLEDIVKSAHEILDPDSGVPLPPVTAAADPVPTVPAVQMVDAPTTMATEPTAAPVTPEPAPVATATPPAADATPSSDAVSPVAAQESADTALTDQAGVSSTVDTSPVTTPSTPDLSADPTTPNVLDGSVSPSSPDAAQPASSDTPSPAMDMPGTSTAPTASPAFSDQTGATTFTPTVAPTEPVAPQTDSADTTTTDSPVVINESTFASPASQATADNSVNNSADTGAGSAASEQAVINKQIEDFIDSVPAEPAEEPSDAPKDDTATTPAQSSDAPTPSTDPSASSAVISPNTAGDDNLLAEAANTFAAESSTVISPTVTPPVAPAADTPPTPATDTPEQPTTPAAPQASQTTAVNDGVAIAHKKLIQPPTTSVRPDLNDLLAKEEAKDAGLSPTPVAARTDAVEDVPFPPHQPGDAFAPQPSAPQQPDQPQQATPPAPEQPKKPNDFDPNSISL